MARSITETEKRFSQLLDSAVTAVEGLCTETGGSSLQGLTRAALAAGRVIGYAEALTQVDPDLGASAAASTISLIGELEAVCAELR